MAESAPSLALINGEIYPFAAPGKASAILSRDGIVSMLGADSEVLQRCGSDTIVLDLRGAVVLPGFVGAGANFPPLLHSPDCSVPLLNRLAAMAEGGVTLAQGDCFGWRGEERLFDLLRELDAAERLPLRVMPRFSARSLKEAEEILAKRILDGFGGQHDSLLGAGSLEIVLDGSLKDRMAALLDDYSDAPGHRGYLLLGCDELFEMVLAAHRAGWSTALRATGDAAIEQGTAAIAAAMAAAPVCARAPRHRIVLCAAGTPEQHARLAELGIAVEIRPPDLGADWPILLSRLGNERARSAYAWKSLLRKGISLCAALASRDRFVAPLRGMRMLLDRRDGRGKPAEGWMQGEALDRSEAFWLYTGGAAEAMGLHGAHGTLEPGKAADMVTLLENPFCVPLSELSKVEIGMTIVAGRIRRMI